jgi:biotin carboxylase
MADVLRGAGLRVPRQCCSDRLDAVLRWARSEKIPWPLVVKPSKSSCSDGVQLCASEDDVDRAFDSIVGHENVLGLTNRQVVVQEYLSGSEYVVDTVSSEGRHRLVAFWRYRRPAPTPSFMGYDSMELLPGIGRIQESLASAACGGLDALGIRFGPAHSELLWSDAGPVLIEIGARMHGGENPRLAALCGARSHIEETVRACADPEHFAAADEPGYELTRHCTVAFLMPPNPGRLRGLPGLQEIEALESLHDLEVADRPGERVLRVIGWVALIHREKAVVDRNLAELRQLEAGGLYDIDPP